MKRGAGSLESVTDGLIVTSRPRSWGSVRQATPSSRHRASLDAGVNLEGYGLPLDAGDGGDTAHALEACHQRG